MVKEETETTNNKSTKMKFSLVALLLWLVGITVGALSIAGINEAQNLIAIHLFIVTLVLIIFMGMVSLANCILSKGSKDNYEVNDAEKGKDNTGFDAESDKKSTEGQANQGQQNGSTPSANGDEKWVSNYVPFGDYPKGNIVYVKEYVPQDMITDLNGVEVINEEPEYNKDYYN